MHALAASLAEENVLVATFDIAKSFDDLQLAHKKEVYCTIVTAKVGGAKEMKTPEGFGEVPYLKTWSVQRREI